MMDNSSPQSASQSVSHTALASASVFAIAVFLRVPSCYESFWIDELHSAWCVWGNLADIAPRATTGHQSPVYFHGLWLWKQIVGNAEVGLRLSSVLAVAVACSVLTIGITRWSRSIVAGVASGLTLAFESNSLFFGTELRPYAFVILFSSLATVSFLRLLQVPRHQSHSTLALFVISILLATLCQPTAAGVLAFLVLALLTVGTIANRRQFWKISWVDGLLVIATAVVGFALWRITVSDTWEQRFHWSSFATAHQVSDIWLAWDWTWLLIVPTSVTIIVAAVGRFRDETIPETAGATLLLSLLAIGVTALYWTVSHFEWVPVWHRRYFIAVLPMFACIIGGATGATQRLFQERPASLIAGILTAAGLVTSLTYQQGTLQRLHRYPVALAVRGEDWRGALNWIQSKTNDDDHLFLDSGLIEVQHWLARHDGDPETTPLQMEFLLFPTSGPYEIAPDRPQTRQVFRATHSGFGALMAYDDLAKRHQTGIPDKFVILTRRTANKINLQSLRQIKVCQEDASRIHAFGSLSVVEIPTILESEPAGSVTVRP
ncbi:MAG: glycosyltransferase family 39 protein [Rubripirellula sp.]